MDIDEPRVSPQQYELLHGGGAEAAEIAHQRLSRRRFLRRSMLSAWGLSVTASVGGALYMLYPTLASQAGQFGAALKVGKKSDFPAALPQDFQLNLAGVFHNLPTRAYIIHLAKDAPVLLAGATLKEQLDSESIVKDKDGSYWIALYHRCVHLGCTVPFPNECHSFKCPCHGSHYNVTGEWLEGPAPRSLDRFLLIFDGEDVIVNTGVLNNRVPHPDATSRIASLQTVSCWTTV
jgi:cytochrome b6-f complex iron-sulfur subunit